MSMLGSVSHQADRVAAVVGRDDHHAVLVEHRREREDVAHVVVDDQHLLAFEHAVDVVQRLRSTSRSCSDIAGGAAVQEERRRVEQALERVAPRATRSALCAAPPGARARRCRRRGARSAAGAPTGAASSASITSSGPKPATLPSVTRQSTPPPRAPRALLGRSATITVGVARRARRGAVARGRRVGISSSSLRLAARRRTGTDARAPRRPRPATAAACSRKPTAPGVERAFARVIGRDHADRDVARRQVGLQPLEDAPAFHVGQEDVERDHRRLVVARHRERAGAARADQPLEAAARAPPEQHLGEREVVLDDQQHLVAGQDVVAVVVRDVGRRDLHRLAAPAASAG